MRRVAALLSCLGVAMSCVGSAPDAALAHPAAPTATRSLARTSPRAPVPPVTAAPDLSETRTPPLDEPALIELEVRGFGPAVVSTPRGATTRRPVLVAAHGASDRPEDLCRAMRELTGDRGFVLCPRGAKVAGAPTVFDFESAPALRREVLASLDALEKRFADHVDLSRAVYAGFSLGSLLGVHLLAERGELFSRALLIEGGWDRWTPEHARAYREKGGERVLFACGETTCPREARATAARLTAGGLLAEVVVGEGEGHRYGGHVTEAIEARFAWLTAGDERWAP